uniref:Uncharacterized protein n=1 Tax=Oryza sativa subsp. japonica TaxID=39947 RepID=Q69UY6_ORYSJ|nr:unknown protein [Oryza sativa Japonica Group]
MSAATASSGSGAATVDGGVYRCGRPYLAVQPTPRENSRCRLGLDLAGGNGTTTRYNRCQRGSELGGGDTAAAMAVAASTSQGDTPSDG